MYKMSTLDEQLAYVRFFDSKLFLYRPDGICNMWSLICLFILQLLRSSETPISIKDCMNYMY